MVRAGYPVSAYIVCACGRTRRSHPRPRCAASCRTLLPKIFKVRWRRRGSHRLPFAIGRNGILAQLDRGPPDFQLRSHPHERLEASATNERYGPRCRSRRIPREGHGRATANRYLQTGDDEKPPLQVHAVPFALDEPAPANDFARETTYDSEEE